MTTEPAQCPSRCRTEPRRGRCRLVPLTAFLTLSWLSGCLPPAPSPEYVDSVGRLLDPSRRTFDDAADYGPLPEGLLGPQPVEAFVRRALAENRALQAARARVKSQEARVPQAGSLPDPVLQATVWPLRQYGPQDSLMGYNPFGVTLTQEFPWFGTLGLRERAEVADVELARAELARAELEAATAVKDAYYQLYYFERAGEILEESRLSTAELSAIARERYRVGNAGHADVLRADVAVSQVDRELVGVREGLAAARAVLAEQLHVSTEEPLSTLPSLRLPQLAADATTLVGLAAESRPDVRARLAAVVRDGLKVELARKGYYPSVQVGSSYSLMTNEHSSSAAADGRDKLGLIVGLTLPIHRARLDAALAEAESRAVESAQLYEAELDRAASEIRQAVAQVQARTEAIDLLRTSILPRRELSLRAAAHDYESGTLDFAILIATWQDLLGQKLDAVREESELARSFSRLERAVGTSNRPVIAPGNPPSP